MARFGRLDALVNNAGLGMGLVSERFTTHPTRFWETPPEAWRRIVDTNLNGAFHMAAAAARAMVPQGSGKIVNVSTSLPTMVRRGYAPYGPTKAALEAASRVWAQDLEGTGVTVNVYLPGVGASDTALIPGGPGPDGRRRQPPALPRSCGGGIVWLCSGGLGRGEPANATSRGSGNPSLPPDEAAAGARDAPAPCAAVP